MTPGLSTSANPLSALGVRRQPAPAGSRPATQVRTRKAWIVSPLYAVLLALMALLNTVVYVDENTYFYARFTIACCLAFPAVIVICMRPFGQSIPRALLWPMAWLVILMLLHVPREHWDLDSITSMAQVGLVAIFFLSLSSFYWPNSAIRCLAVVASGWILTAFAYWVVDGAHLPFEAYVHNGNVVGAVTAHLMAIAMLAAPDRRRPWTKVFQIALLAIGTIVILASQSRAALLAVMVSVAVYFCWNYIVRSHNLFKTVLPLFLTGIAIFVAGQTAVMDYLDYHGLGAYSYELTGERLATRTGVWTPILEAVGEKPLLGHGELLTPQEVLGEALSAHCLYLQVALHGGLVGMAALLLALGSIWRIFWKGRFDPCVRVAGSVLFGVLVHQSFEVALTQNHLAIGLMAWLVFSVGVSRSVNRPKVAAPRSSQLQPGIA